MKHLVSLWLALSLVPLSAFGHGGEDHGAAPAVAASSPVSEAPQRLADGSLFVPKAAQRALGILTAPARAGEFPRVLEMPGKVVADPNAGGRVQVAQAGTLAAGPQGWPLLGQRVQQGQVLAYLMPTLDAGSRADKEASLAELSAQAAVLEGRLARMQQLEGSIPRKEIEQVRIELESLGARRQAMRGALGGRIPLRAPVSGVVGASQGVVGQVVEARDIIFEIVDPRRLAVEALAFEALPAGLGRASARLDGVSESLNLRFLGAARSLREQALPVMFRIEAPGKGGDLPPVAIGQTLKVLAETRERRAGVAVPVAALVRNGANESVVWVHERAERFVPRVVRSQPLDGQQVLVIVGLEGGERVVVQGAQSLIQVR